VPATASTAGKQASTARTPFTRAEQSRATRICSAAPKRSEQGAISTRVSAVMHGMVNDYFATGNRTAFSRFVDSPLKLIEYKRFISNSDWGRSTAEWRSNRINRFQASACVPVPSSKKSSLAPACIKQQGKIHINMKTSKPPFCKSR
jgi:hypothetical protein